MSLTSIESTYQMLQAANRFLVAGGMPALFDVHLVGLGRHEGQATGLFTVHPDLLIGQVEKTQLIVIPAVYGDQDEILRNNRELIPWIIRHYRNGAEVASYCLGAYLLAATGLLDGKPCTTHWLYAGAFRKRYPGAKLVDDKIVTEERGVYTSGGAFSSPNLLLHLIEKYAGREIAIQTAKTYAIDIDRRSQAAFVIFQGQRAHDDETVKDIQVYIESHVAERMMVGELASRAGIGRRSLERRFKEATGNPVGEYILRVKVEAAKRRLESDRGTVLTAMHDVGYTDVGAFRNSFRKVTGVTPQQYRKKYRRLG